MELLQLAQTIGLLNQQLLIEENELEEANRQKKAIKEINILVKKAKATKALLQKTEKEYYQKFEKGIAKFDRLTDEVK